MVIRKTWFSHKCFRFWTTNFPCVNTHFLYDEVMFHNVCEMVPYKEKCILFALEKSLGFTLYQTGTILDQCSSLKKKKTIWPWRWHFLHRIPQSYCVRLCWPFLLQLLNSAILWTQKLHSADLSVWGWLYSNKTLFTKNRWQARFHW